MREALAGWKKTDLKPTLPPNPAPQTARRVFLVDRPDSVQTNLVLGNLAITRGDPDYVALTVMNEILGGLPVGRLFMNLREAKGYTYGAYSQVDAQQFIGTIAASSQVRTGVTDGALTEFFHEFQRLTEQPVPADELEKTKRALVAGFGSSLEMMVTVLNHWLTVERYGLPDDYWDSYPDKVMAVTAADVQRVAKKYLNPNAVQVVAVGDAVKIKTVLEKWGAVTVYNTEGKLAPGAAAGK